MRRRPRHAWPGRTHAYGAASRRRSAHPPSPRSHASRGVAGMHDAPSATQPRTRSECRRRRRGGDGAVVPRPVPRPQLRGPHPCTVARADTATGRAEVRPTPPAPPCIPGRCCLLTACAWVGCRRRRSQLQLPRLVRSADTLTPCCAPSRLHRAVQGTGGTTPGVHTTLSSAYTTGTPPRSLRGRIDATGHADGVQRCCVLRATRACFFLLPPASMRARRTGRRPGSLLAPAPGFPRTGAGGCVLVAGRPAAVYICMYDYIAVCGYLITVDHPSARRDEGSVHQRGDGVVMWLLAPGGECRCRLLTSCPRMGGACTVWGWRHVYQDCGQLGLRGDRRLHEQCPGR